MGARISIEIVPAGKAHVRSWASLRSQLWPEADTLQHEADVVDFLAEIAQGKAQICFLAMLGDEAIGFAEASIRQDYVNGCDTSPVGFLEGIYVRPARRRSGVARRLLESVEAWACRQGCSELGSDAALTNLESQAFHSRAGFDETERVVFFRKTLERPNGRA